MIGLPRRECSQRNEPRARLDWSLLLMSLAYRRDRQSYSSPGKSLGDFFLPLWVRFGLYRHRTGTSVPEGKADLKGAKADFSA